VVVAFFFFASGSTIKWIAIAPAKWSAFGQLVSHFASHVGQYIARFVLWSVVFCVSLKALGFKPGEFCRRSHLSTFFLSSFP
jgi:hypothetical protein